MLNIEDVKTIVKTNKPVNNKSLSSQSFTKGKIDQVYYKENYATLLFSVNHYVKITTNKVIKEASTNIASITNFLYGHYELYLNFKDTTLHIQLKEDFSFLCAGLVLGLDDFDFYDERDESFTKVKLSIEDLVSLSVDIETFIDTFELYKDISLSKNDVYKLKQIQKYFSSLLLEIK